MEEAPQAPEPVQGLGLPEPEEQLQELEELLVEVRLEFPGFQPPP
jgi:hypothetical protein